MDEETQEQVQKADVCEAVPEKKKRQARKKVVRRTWTSGKKASLKTKTSESLESDSQEEIPTPEVAQASDTLEPEKAETPVSDVQEVPETEPSDALGGLEESFSSENAARSLSRRHLSLKARNFIRYSPMPAWARAATWSN